MVFIVWLPLPLFDCCTLHTFLHITVRRHAVNIARYTRLLITPFSFVEICYASLADAFAARYAMPDATPPLFDYYAADYACLFILGYFRRRRVILLTQRKRCFTGRAAAAEARQHERSDARRSFRCFAHAYITLISPLSCAPLPAMSFQHSSFVMMPL